MLQILTLFLAKLCSMLRLLFSLILLLNVVAAPAQIKKGRADDILGKWTANEKVLTIQVYKLGAEYRARIVSFTDHHNATPSMQRTDEHNPDKAKRGRKVIGMDVLTRLSYNTAKNIWTNGQIYDAGSGKTYSAALDLNSNGILSVRAYKGISLLGKTLTFHR